MVRLGPLARAALAAVSLGLLAALGAAACSNGQTPDCPDASCGYPLPDVAVTPSEAGTAD
jgi:hypothetical protein